MKRLRIVVDVPIAFIWPEDETAVDHAYGMLSAGGEYDVAGELISAEWVSTPDEVDGGQQ